MTWDEATGNVEFNIFGIFSVIAAFILSLLNGTLLSKFPNLNIPEMNVHDAITISLSILSGIFVIVKIANGILSFISKRRDMREDKMINNKIREKFSKKK